MVLESKKISGTLYIVATPIGNLQDISLRALDILKSVDCILTEDTRHASKLLNNFGIKKKLISFYDHNEKLKSNKIIFLLEEGSNIALITDAGTPLISDPGYFLVSLVRSFNIKVVPIPGPCALITALSAAGVPCDNFTFSGFLPHEKQTRREKLKLFHTSIPHTLVFYEATHRIIACIEDIGDIYGLEYEFVLAKELTKMFEHFIKGNATTIKDWLTAAKERKQGEFVLMLPSQQIVQKEDHDHLLNVLLQELPLKQAVKIASKITNEKKNILYERALSLKI